MIYNLYRDFLNNILIDVVLGRKTAFKNTDRSF